MSNNLDATNDAARLFQLHANSASLPIPASHPFTHLKQAVTTIPAFQQFTPDPRHLTSIEKHKLKEVVWTHQYQQWRRTGVHPLHTQYTLHAVPKHRDLPPYTHIDTPTAACNRARLRWLVLVYVSTRNDSSLQILFRLHVANVTNTKKQ